MDCDNSSNRKAKLCKFLACGCRRVCSCSKDMKSADKHDDSSRQHPVGADYWSQNPCRPWISSWFDNVDKTVEHSNFYRHEMSVRNEKLDDKLDLYHGGSVFPTQSRRIETATMPITHILPPSHSIIGHPSLKIYRFRLPNHLLHLLDQIVVGCADHAKDLPTGWMCV